jgi:hypothetical protein
MSFEAGYRGDSVLFGERGKPTMPLKMAQWTGIAVTAIVVSGTDMDVVYAVPLGIFAGAIATFCTAMGERYRPRDYPASAGMELRNSSNSKKLG